MRPKQKHDENRPKAVLPELTLPNLCTLTLHSPQEKAETNVQKIYNKF